MPTEESEIILKDSSDEYGSTANVSRCSTPSAYMVPTTPLELEELYEMVGRGSGQYIYWFLTSLIAISEMAEIAMISVILPFLRCQWGLTPFMEGVISISVFIAYAASSILVGNLADRYGRKTLLAASLSVLIVATIVSAVSPNQWIFIVARSVAGACVGLNMTAMVCYSTEFSRSDDRLIGMTIFNVVSSLGPAYVNFFAWLTLNHLGWQWFIVVVSAPMVPALPLVLFLPDSPRYNLVSGQPEKAIDTFRFLAKCNKKSLPLRLKLRQLSVEDLGSHAMLLSKEHKRSAISLSLLMAANVFIGFAFILFQPLILMNGCERHPSPIVPYTCKLLTNKQLFQLTITNLALCVGNITGSITSHLFGRLTSLRFSNFLLLVSITPMFACVSKNFLTLNMAAIEFFGGIVNSIVWIIMPEIFPTTIRSTACGFISGCGKIGGVLGSGAVAVFYYIDPVIVVALLLAAGLVELAMSFVFKKETKHFVMKDC